MWEAARIKICGRRNDEFECEKAGGVCATTMGGNRRRPFVHGLTVKHETLKSYAASKKKHLFKLLL